MPVEGETRTNPNNPSQIARWTGGRWVMGAGDSKGTPRPDYGDGAYETVDGSILKPTRTGGVQQLRGTQGATGEARTRLALGLSPSIAAERMLSAKTANENPLNSLRAVAGDVMMGKGDNGSVFDAMGKSIGGQPFQDMVQASKSFESAFLPILSGAAVTPSEAQRMMRASIPQMGDSVATLQRKTANRKMMINAAAKLGGKPIPFPEVGVADFGNQGGGSQADNINSLGAMVAGAQPDAGKVRRYNPKTGRIE